MRNLVCTGCGAELIASRPKWHGSRCYPCVATSKRAYTLKRRKTPPSSSLPGESWVPAYGFEGTYVVSSLGRVRRLGTYGALLKPSVKRQGYLRVNLHNPPLVRSWFVHRLVLFSFVGPPPDGREAAHLDGNPGNNSLDNLAWKTKRDNHADKVRHGTAQRGEKNPNAKLTNEIVRQLRQLRANGLSVPEAARRLGIKQHGGLWAVCAGTSWKNV